MERCGDGTAARRGGIGEAGVPATPGEYGNARVERLRHVQLESACAHMCQHVNVHGIHTGRDRCSANTGAAELVLRGIVNAAGLTGRKVEPEGQAAYAGERKLEKVHSEPGTRII